MHDTATSFVQPSWTGPRDQASTLRELAASIVTTEAATGRVVFSFATDGHLVEIVERPRASFARYAVYVTSPGGERKKTDTNWHAQEMAIEDGLKTVKQAVPQFKMPPDDAAFKEASRDADDETPDPKCGCAGYAGQAGCEVHGELATHNRA